MSQTSAEKWGNKDKNATKSKSKDEAWSNNSIEREETTNSSAFKRQSHDNFRNGGGDYSSRPPRTDMECYNCHEMGHMSRNCPKKSGDSGGSRPPKACFKCGISGHLSFECQGVESDSRRTDRRRSRSRDKSYQNSRQSYSSYQRGDQQNTRNDYSSQSRSAYMGGGSERSQYGNYKSGDRREGFQSGDRKPNECFKCHQLGHFARECPESGGDGDKRGGYNRSSGGGDYQSSGGRREERRPAKNQDW